MRNRLYILLMGLLYGVLMLHTGNLIITHFSSSQTAAGIEAICPTHGKILPGPHAPHAILKASGEQLMPSLLAEMMEERFSGSAALIGDFPSGILFRPVFYSPVLGFDPTVLRTSDPLYIAFHELRL